MVEEPEQPGSSLLIYDGDCAFCCYCIDYARALGAPGLEFEALQSAAARYPGIPLEEFRSAVQLLEADGTHTRAAAASFRVLALGGRPLAWWLYRHAPGARVLCEGAYRWVAAHRGVCYRVCRVLWGRELLPANHALVDGLFLRLLGLILVAAFASFLVQAAGLIGSDGIAPVRDYLAAVREHTGTIPWAQLPTLFWFASDDTTIRALCWVGIGGGIVLAAGIRSRLVLFALYLLYLSVVLGGQVFMQYQWDSLLIESTFHALLLLGWPVLGRWACRWLLFRFMFEAGFAKIASADPTWASWTALRYHFETQPLPTPLAWYAHHAPPALLETATGAALGVEVLLPFLIVLPRRVRLLPCGGFMLLQLLILLTGNYNFFNLLVLVLCLLLLDDRQLGSVLPGWLERKLKPRRPTLPPGIASRAGTLAACLLVVLVSAVQLGGARGITGWRATLLRTSEPWFVCNVYGLFASMTTQRPEIVIEGSDDRIDWHEYAFRYKPGDPQRALGFNIPHQPRLDWQLWFAALQPDIVQPWFYDLTLRLLEGSAPVRALLAGEAYRDAPPRYLRARVYLYRFSTPAERATGAGPWQRQLLGEYLPPTRLATNAGAAPMPR